MTESGTPQKFDAIVVGAGFAGLYMLHRLRDYGGLSVRVLEDAGGVGGTWYWNRYPGARCDTVSYLYCYSFSEELYRDWEWSGKYPTQPELLAYLEHVTDRFDLRRDIQFNTRVAGATFVEGDREWEVRTDQGETFRSDFLITAVGLLASAAYMPAIDGIEDFTGEVYHTGRWPQETVSLAGKTVGVIGTGSSGVQSVPLIANEAEQLYVFQRTAQFTLPAQHHTVDRSILQDAQRNFQSLRVASKLSDSGLPRTNNGLSATEATPEQRQELFEELWARGGFEFLFESYRDLLTDRRANDYAAEFVRARIRETVRNPALAEALVPADHPVGARRPIVSTNYHEAFNRPNVTLVDIRHFPITRVGPSGVETTNGSYDLDVLVFATGFDAVSGPLLRIDLKGREGLSLREKWSSGAASYLGIGMAGFPNLFTITGPGSAVGGNLVVGIEHHVEWIADCISYMRAEGHRTIEACTDSEAQWMQRVDDLAHRTLIPLADSYLNGANIPGKASSFLIYFGTYGSYRKRCDDVAANAYAGFAFDGDVPARLGG